MVIMGIDPGAGNTGIAVYTIDDKTFDILKIENILINLTKSKYDIDNDNLLFQRLNRLYKICIKIFSNYDVFWIGIESAFLNRLRPAAYAPVVTSIYSIKKAFIDTYNTSNIVEYPPMMVKHIVAEYGGATKDDMYMAVKGIKEINDLIDIDIISEHEVDALAMGYTLLTQIRKTPEILIMR